MPPSNSPDNGGIRLIAQLRAATARVTARRAMAPVEAGLIIVLLLSSLFVVY